MSVRLDWEKLTNDKHSCLLRKTVNHGRKKFYEIDPWTTGSIFSPDLRRILLTELSSLQTVIRGLLNLCQVTTIPFYDLLGVDFAAFNTNGQVPML
jgi:hypothetical protein